MYKRNTEVEPKKDANIDVKFVDATQAQKITNLGRCTVDKLARTCNARHKVGSRVLYEVEPLLNAIREM